MKILAILLIIISLSKILFILSNTGEDLIKKHSEEQVSSDPEIVGALSKAILTADGVIGLFCGSFIFLVL